MREKHHRISPKTTARARRLRHEMTIPERLLWSRLRAKQLGGAKFRHQHAIGSFIADFYCASANLVIELDGQSHDGRQLYDQRRTEYLVESGCRVVRYTNDQIIEDVDAVLEDIAVRVQNATLDPPPTPSLKGRGVR